MEFAIEANLNPIRLFTAGECLELCRAIILADHDQLLLGKWKKSPRRAQLLLIRFAELGVEKTLKKTLKEYPIVIDDSFE